MAIRGSSLAGAIIPVGGPAGLSGQSAYAAWLALGNTGSIGDFIASLKGADGLVRSINGASKSALSLGDIGAAPLQAFGPTRAQIPNRVMLVSAFRVSGFTNVGDYGAGAVYVAGSSTGPMAIQDASGAWYQLDLGAPVMFAGWFGVAPGILTPAQGALNRIGLALASTYLSTGRVLYTPTGKIALTPDPANINAPAWNLGDGTTNSVATTAAWTIRPVGGCSTPGAGELGGPGGTEFVAVGAYGTGPMIRVNGPIPGIDVRASVNAAGLAATGVDIIHPFRSHLEIEAQGYTVNGAVLRTINGPTFSGLTQGFMECTGRITATQPANRTAEGVVLRACEATVAKANPAYFYQGFSRNEMRIKAEIPGATGCAGIVVDRIDNNGLPLCFPFIGGGGFDAGAGGVRGIASSDGFFPCENNFAGGHVIGGFIGQWGSGGNFAVPYSTSDGEPLPALGSGFQFWTYTGLIGYPRRIYGDSSSTLTQPTYSWGAWQNTGLGLAADGSGAGFLVAGGILGLQWDTSGRVGLGMAPVAGYGAAINGDLNLSGGSRTIYQSSGSYFQLQAQVTIFLATAGQQQVTVDANGIYPSTTNRNCGLSSSQWLNVFSAAGTFSGPVKVGTYTVATLPTAGVAGRLAFATNGRALQSGGALEAAGSGTGCLVTDSGSAWRIAGTNITVSA
ncbi:hypothetical protein ACLBYG_20695 [Methylobacterium sp. D53M]